MAKRKSTTTWANRIVGEGDEAPDQLLANPLNFRVHTQEQGDALAGGLTTIGWVQRVIVNRRTGHVIDGHLRISQAMKEGQPTVPVVYVDLDEAEERIALATLDPIAAMAGTDKALLSELLSSVEAEDERLASFLAGLTPEEPSGPSTTSASGVPGEELEPTTRRGELIHLDLHRLLCGEPTLVTHRRRLIGTKTDRTIRNLAELATLGLTGHDPTDRLYVMVEDPATCDSLVNAWEKATGLAAKRFPPKA